MRRILKRLCRNKGFRLTREWRYVASMGIGKCYDREAEPGKRCWAILDNGEFFGLVWESEL
jgi:hypothetical protein